MTERELEVLRLVAAGHTNRQIAARLVLSERTVAHHLDSVFGGARRILAGGGNLSRLAQGAGLSTVRPPA